MWWHTVKHGRGSEGETGQMEWVASTLHTTSEHCVSSITTTDAHTSAASSQLNWRPSRFKWTQSVSLKDKIWFLRVRYHISTGLYLVRLSAVTWTILQLKLSLRLPKHIPWQYLILCHDHLLQHNFQFIIHLIQLFTIFSPTKWQCHERTHTSGR